MICAQATWAEPDPCAGPAFFCVSKKDPSFTYAIATAFLLALRIRGEKRSGAAQQGRRYHLMERAYGRFERRIPLPHGVDVELAEVAYRDGVFTVILPKTEIVPPR